MAMSTTDVAADVRILRLAEVEHTVGKKRSTIYRDIAAGKFPGPVEIGGKSVGWLSTEINDWVQSRPRAQLRSAQEFEL